MADITVIEIIDHLYLRSFVTKAVDSSHTHTQVISW
jgi:hypothetical protein